jgi:hypothetical protein
MIFFLRGMGALIKSGDYMMLLFVLGRPITSIPWRLVHIALGRLHLPF